MMKKQGRVEVRVKMTGVLLAALLAAGLAQAGFPQAAQAQQKIGYIDSAYILNQLPEYATVQQRLDQLAERWQAEVEAQQEEVEELTRVFQARRLLYTDEERQRRQQEIAQAREEAARLREQYFGPEGLLYTQQQELMRPVQERVLTAVETVARAEDYDYVFDKSGGLLFMYAREEYDLSDAVLQELGIDVEDTARAGN